MKPIFLVGAERSGTTLLRLMLDAHPSISWLNEFEYSVDKITNPNSWPDLDTFYDYLSTDRIFHATQFKIDKDLSYPSLIKSFLDQKRQRDNKNIIGATCHRYYDRLLRLFPEASFIYLLRDPRDVAKSNIKMGWAGNVWKGIDRWITAEKLWEEVKSQLANNAYIEVKYEDLIFSTEKILALICSFIGVPYMQDMLSYPEKTTYSKPDPSLINQWKNTMKTKEIRVVESKAAKYMVSRGYKVQTEAFYNPTELEKLYYEVENKIIRKLFYMKRYGIFLVIGQFFAKKFGLKNIDRRLKIIFNKKTKRYLK